MSSKKWITIWSLIPIILITFSLLGISIFSLPLRFSNSISYDVKLNFMKDYELMNQSNTVVVGSSMALNNINGIKLEDSSKKINKVANISSWGLQTSEVLQLIKLINLDKVDYIIYSTQYIDFQYDRLKNIDESEVEKYLNNQFTIYPYTTTIKSLISNLSNNINYDSIYMNPNKYRYLDFDRTGSINFTFDSKYIIKSRWESNYKDTYNLSEKCFEDLVKLSKISEVYNIKLIVITTPMRESILLNNSTLLSVFNKYTKTLESLSSKHKFIYINAHKELNLSDNYFVDKTHLNKDGATLVSSNIIKHIN